MVCQKIVKKAINIKKKKHPKQEIIEQLLSDDSSEEEEKYNPPLVKVGEGSSLFKSNDKKVLVESLQSNTVSKNILHF